jgi:CheY-like chemotaxis protein
MIKLLNEHEIIMVDDSDMDLHLAKRCLARSKVKNKFVGLMSAAELYQYLDEVKAKKHEIPAIVLLDINMPTENGHEALIKIRQDTEFKVLPLIAMFSHSSAQSDIDQSIKNGANTYMVKPSSLIDYVSFFNSLID